MFSIFNHVMKSVRDTNSEPGLPVILLGPMMRWTSIPSRKGGGGWNCNIPFLLLHKISSCRVGPLASFLGVDYHRVQEGEKGPGGMDL